MQIRDMTGEEIAVFAEVIHELARPTTDIAPREATSDRILRIWRNRHREPFGQREVDLLDTLALHVAKALNVTGADSFPP